MATIYVDPTVSGTGAGTFADPYKSWASVSWVAGNTYLQKEKTTFRGKITVSTGGTSETSRVTLGVYNASTGNQIVDGSSKAIIDATNQDRGIQVSTTQNYVTINGFEVFGPSSSSTRRCITYGSTNSSVSNYINIRYCILHDPITTGADDVNGISGFGSNSIIEDNEIFSIPTDGMWLQGNNLTIRRNKIYNVATDGRIAGDCIQIFSDGTLSSNNFIVTDNYLDHRNRAVKQCFIHSGTGSSGGLFARNIALMAPYDGNSTSVCFIQSSGAIIKNNYLEGGYYAYFYEGANQVVVGNIIVSPQRGCTLNVGLGGEKFYNNTVIGALIYGAHMNVADSTNEIKNNIFLNCKWGIGKHGTSTEDYNNFYGCEIDQVNVGGTPAWGSNKFTYNPQLDSYFIPQNLLLRGIGTSTSYLLDPTPDLGAKQYRVKNKVSGKRGVCV